MSLAISGLLAAAVSALSVSQSALAKRCGAVLTSKERNLLSPLFRWAVMSKCLTNALSPWPQRCVTPRLTTKPSASAPPLLPRANRELPLPFCLLAGVYYRRARRASGRWRHNAQLDRRASTNCKGTELKAIDGIETPDWDAVRMALVAKIGDRQTIVTVAPFGTNQRQDKILDLQHWAFEPDKQDPVASLGIQPRRRRLIPSWLKHNLTRRRRRRVCKRATGSLKSMVNR